jgi:hypothetical protein
MINIKHKLLEVSTTRNEISLCDLKINGQLELINCEIKDIETTNLAKKTAKTIKQLMVT